MRPTSTFLPSTTVSLVASAAAVALVAALALGAARWGATVRSGQVPGPSVADISAACAGPNPFLAAAVFAHGTSPEAHARAPAIVAFRDTMADDPAAHPVLATQADVGAVYGLAYDPGRRHLYAAAYHRRGQGFGPGGPGQIYRIDVESGVVEPWATLAAGPDRHEPDPRDDPRNSQFVGVTSLGDIELDDSSTILAVVNLYDRKIYRLSVPDGRIIGSFPHGASATRWERNARPLGLGVHDGWLYHGVVDSRTFDTVIGSLSASMYRSRWDGTQMAEAARIPLDAAGSWWRTWSQGPAKPMFADIVFRPNGDVVIGLRNRTADVSDDPSGHFSSRQNVGDVLPGKRVGDRFEFQLEPQHYADDTYRARFKAWGTLAVVPGLDTVVASAQVTSDSGRVEAYWLDNPSGHLLGRTLIADVARDASMTRAVFGAGDVEVLCPARPGIDQALVATATAEAVLGATATVQTATARAIQRLTEDPPTQAAEATRRAATAAARATVAAEATAVAAATATGRVTANVATATALAPTLEAAAPARTAAGTLAARTMTAVVPALTAQATNRAARMTAAATQLAVAPSTMTPAAATAAAVRARLTSDCGGDNPYFAVTCFMPSLDGTGTPFPEAARANSPVLVAFNDTQPEDPTLHVPLAYELQLGAIFGVAWDDRRAHLYASAYHKRLTAFGPLGPGGIYRVNLQSGLVEPFAWLPAGQDEHDPEDLFDRRARRWIGKTSLGDIELNERGDVLLVVNLDDRLIYRIAVPEGRVLGAFPHGAIGEPWAADAWPFGLGVRDGWVYHGVVDGRAGSPANLAGMMAYVYRSRDDGTEMHEVVRLPLDYPRDLQWPPWTDGATTGRDPTGAMLTDIEFRSNGDLVLGLRDRQADSGLLTSGTIIKGQGDMLAVHWLGTRGIAQLSPSHFRDTLLHSETTWGTLARMYGADEIVSTALDPSTDGPWDSGGALWFDGAHGGIVGAEVVYSGHTVAFGKAAGLGDIELLCPPGMPPPSPTASPSPSPTPTPSPSATTVPTATATGTSRPGRIYLPVADNQWCREVRTHVDIVLVVDASTSMQRLTRDDRPKLDAAVAAASAFVDLLDMATDGRSGGDRVGIVGFNREAWTATELSSDRDRIGTALAGLAARAAEGTRLDLAFRHGQDALAAAGASPNQPTMIVLTDGLPNGVPTPVAGGTQEDAVLAAAAEAKARGSRVFTVGLGVPDDVLQSLLAAAASTPDDFLYAPDAEDLVEIYRRIAGRIGACP